jgi:YfiR/HmsC-like
MLQTTALRWNNLRRRVISSRWSKAQYRTTKATLVATPLRDRSVWGSLRRLTWTMALAACLAGPAATAAGPSLELAVKAAYLAKFAPFVVWPEGAFAAPNAPLVLCVQGDDPFDGMLDRLTAGESVGPHPVVVRRLPRLDPASGCQIAYLAGSSAQSPAAALKAVEGQPVLTVTDAEAGGGQGIVHLVLVGGRVRFMIDAEKAGQSQLGISSKLLALAVEVKR